MLLLILAAWLKWTPCTWKSLTTKPWHLMVFSSLSRSQTLKTPWTKRLLKYSRTTDACLSRMSSARCGVDILVPPTLSAASNKTDWLRAQTCSPSPPLISLLALLRDSANTAAFKGAQESEIAGGPFHLLFSPPFPPSAHPTAPCQPGASAATVSPDPCTSLTALCCCGVRAEVTAASLSHSFCWGSHLFLTVWDPIGLSGSCGFAAKNRRLPMCSGIPSCKCSVIQLRDLQATSLSCWAPRLLAVTIY